MTGKLLRVSLANIADELREGTDEGCSVSDQGSLARVRPRLVRH
jgi:hypothetical protein